MKNLAGGVGCRILAAVTVLVCAAGLVTQAAPEGFVPVADPDGRAAAAWWDDLDNTKPQTRKAPAVPPTRSADKIKDRPAKLADHELSTPKPVTAELTLSRPGERQRVAGTPVTVAAGSDAGAGRGLRFQVLDQAAVNRAGASGLVFRVTAQDPGGFPIDLSVDYSSFTQPYGAGLRQRLRIVALPECAVAAEPVAGCLRGGAAVPSRNDVRAGQLQVKGADLGSLQSSRLTSSIGKLPGRLAPARDTGTGVLLAVVTAADDGELGGTGDFKATPLELSSDWQVGPGSGEFSWSYPVPVPKAPAGATPEVQLAYSSGTVDGMTSTRNTQAGQNGLGFSDFANAFVERRYTTCSEEADEFAASFYDLCWKSENATIALNGRSSELVKVPNTTDQWVLKRDARWKVEQLHAFVPNGDRDGEHWKVTTPDGTQYFFGLGIKPEQNNALTNSAYTVPVVANHPGEPCRDEPSSWCQQGWRWNLDRVVDPNGNVTTYTYEKETNKYQVVMGLGGLQSYNPGGRLVSIEYGGNTGAFNGGTAVPPQGKITFDAAYRCASLSPAPGGCAAPNENSTTTQYPDVPVDLICETTCDKTSPSFFTTRRYTKVTTSVLVGGTFTPVDEVALTHSHDDNGGGDLKLYLKGIQRTGRAAATALVMPPVNVGYVKLDNRSVSATSTASKMPHYRVNSVNDEYGRKISVTYGRPHPCDGANWNPYPNGGWDNNRYNCYPQQWTPENATQPLWGFFHKWLVTQVKVEDTTGGSPAMLWDYTYGTTDDAYPAWHHDADEFVKLSDQSWADWRGYGTVTVTQGNTRTRQRVFRGMQRDRLAGGGEKTVTVRNLDGTAPTPDYNWLRGHVHDETKLAADGSVLKGVLHEYQSITVVDDDANSGNEPHPTKASVWAGEKITTERLKRDGGFVSKRTTTSYNGLLRFPETVHEEGFLHVTGDERCTRTVYVIDSGKWMFDFPRSKTLVKGACSSTTVLNESENAYDGGTVGAAPTRGNITLTRTHISGSTWSETATTYDPLGRPRTVKDANQGVTTTTHTPTTGYPTRTEVVNPAGHKEITDWNVPVQMPANETNARSKVTNYGYDALSRITKVWRPTEPTSGPASWEFVYTVSPTKAAPPVVRTRQLQSTSPATVYLDTWKIHDSLLRERQSQSLSPAAGKVIVTNTAYDNRGLVASKSLPQALPGTGGGLLAPQAPDKWDNEHGTAYDELERPIWELFVSEGSVRWSTVSAYGPDTVTRTPHPVGAEIVTTTDAYDKVIKVAEWATRGDSSTAKTTSYGYDLAGQLTSTTDPRGNVTTYSYDLAGRRIQQTDRDKGTWTYGYDLVGNQTSSKDARNTTTYIVYDALNRPTRRHTGDPAKPLATWTYDRAGETGLLDGSIRWVRTPGEPDRAYLVDTIGYDDRGRPTGKSWVFFDNDLYGLAGTYPVSYTYDRADHRTSVTYPQVGDPQNGGLGQETVTTTYDELGLPDTMDGTLMPTGEDNQDYLYTSARDDRARPLLFGYGTPGSGVGKVWTYDGDQRLARTQAAASGVMLQDREITYEVSPAGSVRKRKNTINARTWSDCYGYDLRNRLTAAYSTSHADDCSTTGAGGGDSPYHHTYTHSDDGNLTQRVENGDTITYTYPAPGASSVRPHAPTRLDFPGGGDDLDYTWDNNGHQLTRVKGGTTQTFGWDPERMLESIETRNATGSSTASFTYDADGTRLVRRNVDRNTAYFEGHEVSVNGGGQVTAVRTYTLDGQPIATRTAAHGVEYLITDDQGSVELTARNGDSTPIADRTYNPYGAKRTGNDPLTDAGWIGQIEDRRTELNYLNARYYDPAMYRFVSPDPLFDEDRPQTLNPFTYSTGKPSSSSDPTGLIPDDCVVGSLRCSHDGTRWNVEPREEPELDLRADDNGITLDELEEVGRNADTTVDVAGLGVELCVKSSGICARAMEFANATEVLDRAGLPVGAIAVGITCVNQGITSDACGRAFISEAIEYIPVAGQVWVVIQVADIDLASLPGTIKDFVVATWNEFFNPDGQAPRPSHDPETQEVYGPDGGPVYPGGGPSQYQTNCGPPLGGTQVYCEDE